MITKKQKFPHKISSFLKERFRENFLFELKEVPQADGHVHYHIEVTKDNDIHHLRFNEFGTLLHEESDEAFPSDFHEGPIF